MPRPQLPAYLDGLIAAYRAGQTGRDLHLGYWDEPPALSTPALEAEFAAAQARLTERAVALAAVRPGQRVLDIACGFGGTLAMIAARVAGSALVGLNLDRRQLAICRDIVPAADGSLALVEADAGALPFAAASFDRLLCIEAMFHFGSRPAFFAEAARLLRPGGRLVVTDILLHAPGAAAPWPNEAMIAALQRDYGPWPVPWVTPAQLEAWAEAAGLMPAERVDWTAQTLPSYRIVAPDPRPERQRQPDAGQVLRWLHANGRLTYQALALQPR